MRSIMEDFYKSKLAPTPLLIDNQAAICMSKLPQFTEKQKRIPIRIGHPEGLLRRANGEIAPSRYQKSTRRCGNESPGAARI
jgi:hypothetical protein